MHDARPRLVSKALLRFDRFSGRTMLLYPERGLELNDTAAEVLRRCDGTRTVAELIEELSATFTGAPAATIERDTVELLERLAARGLVER